ncbi:hypothetical protein BHE74_00013768 [Ensete ventricosum]|nr:hypothetical protein GW17_00007458 [Ensete ventricosum]RWW78035.1 hypothetical protein BHE74_00013768 [Ensete ventricosum]
MVSASLLETISVIREPPKCRPQRLLRWNPLLQPPRPQFPLIRSRNPIRFALRCASRPQSAAAGDEQKGRPLDVVLRAVLETLDRLKKPAAAIILIGFLLTADSHGVLAASGGRMGGKAFSSSPSRSHSSSSWSYSAPPSSRFSYSAPYYAPSPFGGGFYAGPAFGVGFGAGSGFFLLMMGFAAVILLSGFLSDRADDGSVLTATQKTSVIKLQVQANPFLWYSYVGLLGIARSFQKDLDQIAEAADTSTPEGLNYILTETTLALLRRPDCCISAYSSAVEVLWTPQNENDTLSERELLEDYPLLRPL